MKALTVQQPYANLLLTPEKFVENRPRRMNYRGPLLIHAGKGTKYLDRAFIGSVPTGVLLGVVDVVECVHVTCIRRNVKFEWADNLFDQTPYTWRQLHEHEHTHGPYCIIVARPRVFTTFIPYGGRQGLFSVPDELVAEAINTARAVE